MFKTEGSLLFVTPFIPSVRGNGVAMRAQALLAALAPRFAEVHLMVVPIYGVGAVELEEETARWVTSYRMVPLPPRSRWLRRKIEAWKFRFRWGFGSLPREWHERSIRWDRAIDQACGRKAPDVLFIFRFYLLPHLHSVRRKSGQAWIDLDELESGVREQQAKAASTRTGAEQQQARCEMESYRKMEKRELPSFARIFVSSKVERDRACAQMPGLSLDVLPNIYLRDSPLPPRLERQPGRLLFIGSFSYGPNIEAVEYFCGEVLPLLAQDDVELIVAGMGGDLKWNSQRWPRVRILGRVDDLTPLYAETDLVIVPLLSGTGTRIKILEAFSHQRAVVSTSIGAEGLEVDPALHLRIADGKEALAAACRELLRDDDGRRRLARAGYDFFRVHHRFRNLEQALDSALCQS